MMRRRLAQLGWVAVAMLVLFVAGSLALGQGIHSLSKSVYPRKYQSLVEQYAKDNRLDALVLYSVIRTESGFDPEATSNVEARGLMQITEETFDWIKTKIAPDEPLTFADLYKPEVNIRFGAYYFAQCLLRYENDLATAAAAYHSGWGTVDKLLEDAQYSKDGKTLDVFPYRQMKRYVYKITRAFERYQQLYAEV